MWRISVIIPVYNVKKYLPEALNSVIHQSYTNLEIILIDDGSTDGSELICDQYALKDNRIKVIHQKNQGLSAARNTGLDYSAGQFITFLDSDDALHPEAILRMLNGLITNDVDVVSCGAVSFTTEGAMEVDILDRVNSTIRPGKIITRNTMQAVLDGEISCMAWGKLYRAEIWHTLRYPVGHVHEDFYMILDVMEKAKKAYIMNDALVMYRKRAGSITFEKKAETMMDLMLARRHYATFVKNRVPEKFSYDQLKKVLSENLNVMLTTAITSDMNDFSGIMVNAFLNRELLRFRTEFGIHNCGLKSRAAFIIYQASPALLKVLHTAYLSMIQFSARDRRKEKDYLLKMH